MEVALHNSILLIAKSHIGEAMERLLKLIPPSFYEIQIINY